MVFFPVSFSIKLFQIFVQTYHIDTDPLFTLRP